MEPTILRHLESTPGTCGGKPRIAGTRIRVQDVVILTEECGHSPDEIVAAYPHITLADVHAALAYYFDHRDEINGYIREADELIAFMKANPAPRLPQTPGAGMPTEIRFPLDESMDNAVARGLRLRGIEVTVSNDVGLVSATDEE